MKTLAPKPPDTIHVEEFLNPIEVTAYELSKIIEIPQTRISQTIKGRRRITANTTLGLGILFDVPAYCWPKLQSKFDLCEPSLHLRHTLNKMKQPHIAEVILVND